MDFRQFWQAYEDVVRRARRNELTMDDYAGTTISLTNPGGIGTVHSIPRLMPGQSAIIGVGAMEYPAPYQGMSESHPGRAGGQQDHHADQHVRPPDHPGRAVRRVPQGRCTSCCSASTASTTRSSPRCASRTSRCAGCGTSRVNSEGQIDKTARVHRADPRLPGARSPDGRHRPAGVQDPQAPRPGRPPARADPVGPGPRRSRSAASPASSR